MSARSSPPPPCPDWGTRDPLRARGLGELWIHVHSIPNLRFSDEDTQRAWARRFVALLANQRNVGDLPSELANPVRYAKVALMKVCKPHWTFLDGILPNYKSGTVYHAIMRRVNTGSLSHSDAYLALGEEEGAMAFAELFKATLGRDHIAGFSEIGIPPSGHPDSDVLMNEEASSSPRRASDSVPKVGFLF